MTAAKQLKALRNLCGMTQAEFAAEFEIPRRTLENWESGSRTPPPYVVRLLEHAVRSLQASE